MRLYKSLMRLSTPLLEAALSKRLRLGKEDPLRCAERRGQPQRARGSAPLVWFHGASVGESLSLLALVERVLRDNPKLEVMVTTGTVTSARLMAERLPQGAFHQYIPVDHPVWTENFLDHWRPDLVIWSESEFWPNMLDGIQRRGVPAVLLNARMSEASFRRWKLARASARAVLETFSLCLGQNAAEAARLEELGAKNVRVSANLKYAAAPLPHDPKMLAEMQVIVGARPRLLWASTHLGEEAMAGRVHAWLKREFPALLTIVVPRHPARGAEIAQELRGQGLKVAQRSRGEIPQGENDIYLADTLGELGMFFRLSPLVVMGGSFADIGGHNPIEPAQAGCVVFYGPEMYNFLSIREDFARHGAALSAQDEGELERKLASALRDPSSVAPVAAAALALTGEKAHVLDELSAALSPWLGNLTQKRKEEKAAC